MTIEQTMRMLKFKIALREYRLQHNLKIDIADEHEITRMVFGINTDPYDITGYIEKHLKFKGIYGICENLRS